MNFIPAPLLSPSLLENRVRKRKKHLFHLNATGPFMGLQNLRTDVVSLLIGIQLPEAFVSSHVLTPEIQFAAEGHLAGRKWESGYFMLCQRPNGVETRSGLSKMLHEFFNFSDLSFLICRVRIRIIPTNSPFKACVFPWLGWCSVHVVITDGSKVPVRASLMSRFFVKEVMPTWHELTDECWGVEGLRVWPPELERKADLWCTGHLCGFWKAGLTVQP